MNPTPDKKPAALMIAIGDKKDSPDMADNNYNKIELSDDMLQGMGDGQEVDATIHGKIVVKPDGTRCIEVSEVDGQAVEGSDEEEAAETPEEEQAEEPNDMESAKNNLLKSIQNQGGYSNASDSDE